ncbi:MAG: SDR family oxidoreductase [Burkholderiaceae bacterium]|nr:MAG: SDR family oxidoreductase [Burkholderiaceae bacterium]
MASNEGVVVITGGVSGIGLALTRGLLETGCKVLALDVTPDGVAAARRSLADFADHLQVEAADVTDEARIEALIGACDRQFGPICGLINSAGIAREIPCLDTDVATFRKILDVNVIGSFITSKAVARRMRTRSRGAIVNITSVSGLRGNYGRVAYGSSKGAIVTMTQVMAVELARVGIRVNAIAPGPIDTPLTKAVHTAATRKNWVAAVPLRRYGEPEELLGTAQWLLDDTRSGYVTGQVIAVDGGFTAMGLAFSDAAH